MPCRSAGPKSYSTVSLTRSPPSGRTVSLTSYVRMLSPGTASAGPAPITTSIPTAPTTRPSAPAPRRVTDGSPVGLAAGAARQGALHLPLRLLLREGLPLVVAALAARQGDLDLCR